MMLRILRRGFYMGVLVVTAGIVLIIARSSPEPWTAEEISHLVAGLNEAAAIGVPHDFLMTKQERQQHSALLEKVEDGQVLTAVESAQYRQVFQKTLHDAQGFLSIFDAELSVVANFAMNMENNIHSKGIAGRHDHHDLSARTNFAGLLRSLDLLAKASSSFQRIKFANAAQKDLVDLISHMGVVPNTVSTPYVPPESPWADLELGNEFEEMMRNFKSAQFFDVNSNSYWAAVDAALANYGHLIAEVQQRVVEHCSPWERRIAGRFLATQTLAPPVNLERVPRR